MNPKNSSVYNKWVGAFRGYVSPVVAAIGLVGSFFIILIFSREKPRTRFSIYAISLAVSSAICLLTNTIVDDFLGRGLFYITNHKHFYKLDSTSTFWCKSVEYTSNVMYFVTSYTVILFSVDRLLTLHQPFLFYSTHHKKWAGICCAVAWGIGFLLNSPLLFVQNLAIDANSRTNFTCRRSDQALAKFTITFEVIFTFTIPFCIVLILNGLIYLKLWELKRDHSRLFPTDRSRSQLEMGRVAGHLALSTVFLLLYMPMVCAMLVRLNLSLIHLDIHSPRAIAAIDLSRLFSSVKDITYSVNFWVYLIFLRNYRSRFVQLFYSPCCGAVARNDTKHRGTHRRNVENVTVRTVT